MQVISKPGLGRYTSMLKLARMMLVDSQRNRTKILELSNRAAGSAAGWAYDEHALICARLGLGDGARQALTAEEQHYGGDAAESQTRALIEVILSRTKRAFTA